MKEKICIGIGAAGGLLAAALGGWDLGLQVLLGFMAADLGTGLLTAGVFHNVGAANAADLLLDSHFLRSAVIIGFCASEALSLTENAGRMGIPLPAAWKNAVSLLSRKAQPDSPSEQE